MGPGGSGGQQLTVGPWVLEASVPTRVPAVAGGQRVQLWGPVPVVPFPEGFLFFFSFPLNIFVGFVFSALFPTWYLALVLFSSLCFSSVQFSRSVVSNSL